MNAPISGARTANDGATVLGLMRQKAVDRATTSLPTKAIPDTLGEMRRLRSLLVLLFLPLLGSCSYIYELLAITIDGQVAFAVDPASGFRPDCVDSIYVSADDGEPKARAELGDDKGLVENASVYWWDFRDVRSCKSQFPIVYGDALNGPRADGIGYVKAKPLKQGVVYQVGTSGDGAYGSGWFKILANGEIENYPNDPTPPDRDEDGYLIKSEPDTGAN